jgi:hypothetical protein
MGQRPGRIAECAEPEPVSLAPGQPGARGLRGQRCGPQCRRHAHGRARQSDTRHPWDEGRCANCCARPGPAVGRRHVAGLRPAASQRARAPTRHRHGRGGGHPPERLAPCAGGWSQPSCVGTPQRVDDGSVVAGGQGRPHATARSPLAAAWNRPTCRPAPSSSWRWCRADDASSRRAGSSTFSKPRSTSRQASAARRRSGCCSA